MPVILLLSWSIQTGTTDSFIPYCISLMDIDNDGVPELFLGYLDEMDKYLPVYYWAYQVEDFTLIYANNISEQPEDNYFVRDTSYDRLFRGISYIDDNDSEYFLAYYSVGPVFGQYINATKIQYKNGQWTSELSELSAALGQTHETTLFTHLVYVSRTYVNDLEDIEKSVQLCLADYICRYWYTGVWEVPPYYRDVYDGRPEYRE